MARRGRDDDASEARATVRTSALGADLQRTLNETIERAFNEKLGRARSQKAQYLRIQGSMLKDTHPAAAIRLLERCVDEGDEFHIPHALLDSAHALLVQGEIDAALDRLQAVLEQEKRRPQFRTSAAYDYPFLVALYGRRGRYQSALEQLEGQLEGFFESMIFEAETAKALIFDEQGRHSLAREAARRALEAASVTVGWVPHHPNVGLVPDGVYALRERLHHIAGDA